MKKYVFESLKFFCAAILCTILSAFASPSWGALPTGYTELEYIESTGTQYIDTGVTPAQITKIDSKAQFLRTDARQALLGVSNNGSGPWNNFVGINPTSSTSKFRIQWATATVPEERWNILTDTNLHTFVFDKNALTFTVDNAVNTFADYTIENATGNMYVFGKNNGTQGVDRLVYAKMYYMKLYNGSTLVRDFVPARRNSDNVLGMYDTVNNRFYTNSGSGEFIAGDPVTTCDGTIVNYTSATGTGTQSGTPTPENPIEPTFYKQGNMILRKVGDYADTYDATTGKITRRVGVKVFDGTERLSRSTAYTGSVYMSDTVNDAVSNLMVMSTHFKGGAGTTNYTVGDCIINNNHISFWLNNSNNDNSDVVKAFFAQQYAAGTPVTVWYPLETETTEDWPASYCETPIKIATTKYNESAFSPLNTALANAISVVDTVVSNTITQAASIATLQAQKQTRPADDTCPAYKQCLLVEDENGTPHWYEITDPFRDFVAPIIANNVAPASTTNSAGYTQLEYIESTGTQWIDTGYAPSGTDKIEVKWLMPSVAGNYNVFGVNNGTAWNLGGLGMWWNYGTIEFVKPASNSTSTLVMPKPAVSSNTQYTVTVDKNTFTLNGNSQSIDWYSSYVANRSLYLFATHRSNTVSGYSTINMYYFKIWNNNTLVRNMIPVRNNATGKYGLYDTVGGQFYGNAASSGADFTPGPEVLNQNPDVPGRLWTATWQANQNGVEAGVISGTGRCTSVKGENNHTSANPTKYNELSSANQTAWNTAFTASTVNDYKQCWCKISNLATNSENINPGNSNDWVYNREHGSSDLCATNCADRCALGIKETESYRKALFGD
ncbi:MAG: hypothetical protein IJU89_04405 [Alphaproteobacteria bacterium]|nr:hypothetical protein [Alphaproteobacteria bacterium]